MFNKYFEKFIKYISSLINQEAIIQQKVEYELVLRDKNGKIKKRSIIDHNGIETIIR